MEMGNTYDAKIMNFKGNDYVELLESFSDSEINAMREYLENEIIFEDAITDYDLRYGVVNWYIKCWLCEQIKDNTITGTDKLFSLHKLLW